MLVDEDFYAVLQSVLDEPKCTTNQELNDKLTDLVTNHDYKRSLPEMCFIYMFVIHNSELISKRQGLIRGIIKSAKRALDDFQKVKVYTDGIKQKAVELASQIIYLFDTIPMEE